MVTAVDAISADDISFIGSGLVRPECVLALRDGSLATADWRGGVALTAPDGAQTLIKADRDVEGGVLKPNGIALARDGSFLVTHLDDTAGGLFRLARDGTLTPVLTEMEGAPIPPTNFVLIDDQDRIWVTVSTRLAPRFPAKIGGHATGYVVLMDKAGARIVADDIGFANEVRLDPTGERLYVVETFSQRITRFRVGADGSLSGREVFVAFDEKMFPDGMTFDVEGGLWVTGIYANRLVRVMPDGRWTVIFEDYDPDELSTLVTAYQNGDLAKDPSIKVSPRLLGDVSSLAFGGPDLKTVYLGTLLRDRIGVFQSPVAGVPLAHWDF